MLISVTIIPSRLEAQEDGQDTSRSMIPEIGVGEGPRALDIIPNTDRIYVANEGSETVSVIDGSDNNVVETIALDDTPIDIAANNKTNKVYVSQPWLDTVSAIDGVTNKIVANISVGDFPSGLAINQDKNRVYVVDSESNVVPVIDGSTNKVVSNITVGEPSTGLAYNSETDMLYIATQSDKMLVIDGSTNRLKETITISSVLDPGEVIVDETANKIYITCGEGARLCLVDGQSNNSTIVYGNFLAENVALDTNSHILYGAKSDSDAISVINGSNNRLLTTVNVGHDISAIAVNPRTNTVYVANSDSVSVIDSNTISLSQPPIIPGITVGKDPTALAVNLETNTVYVANSDSDSVSVIDGSTDKVVNNVFVQSRPATSFSSLGYISTVAIGVNPETNKVYVANSDSDSVSVIDGSTGKVVNNIRIGDAPCGIAFSEGRNWTFVVNCGSNNVSIIRSNGTIENITAAINPSNQIAYNSRSATIYLLDDDSNSIVGIERIRETTNNITFTKYEIRGNISLGGEISSFDLNEEANILYASNIDSDSVSVIDLYVNKIVANISVGNNPRDIAVNPKTNTVYVANSDSDSVSVIDGSINSLIRTISVNKDPTALAVNPETNKVYVADGDSNTVLIIDGSINDVVTGVSFNVDPPNAGQIICNSKELTTNAYVRIPFGSQCKADPNSGFVFSSWTESLGPNSSRTLKSSTESDPLSGFFRRLFASPIDNSSLEVTQYGNFVATFREAPSPIPEGVWISLFGIMLGTIMPSIIRWLNGWKQRKRFYKYMEELPAKYGPNIDIKTIEKEITELYAKGKINESQQKMLKDRASEYYDDKTTNGI